MANIMVFIFSSIAAIIAASFCNQEWGKFCSLLLIKIIEINKTTLLLSNSLFIWKEIISNNFK